MTNNHEDFEQPDAGGPGELPPPTGASAKLVHAWRTRPLFKLLVLMVVVGAGIAVAMSIFTTPQTPGISKVVAPPDMKQPPGGQASPYFLEQQRKADQEREKQALQTGQSAIPTPVGQTPGLGELDNNEKPKRDPLIELRSEFARQNEQIAQLRQAQQVASSPPPAAANKPPEQFDNTLAQAMQAEMKSVMASMDPKGIRQVEGVGLKDYEAEVRAEKEKEQKNALDQTNQIPQIPAKVLVAAGTVSYSQLLTEANSDVPGPILAQILSGPLAGARAIGRFKVFGEYLLMEFTNANLKKIDYKMDGIALDPDTTLGGMATEVDERYMTRVVLPAAAAFMSGLGEALGQNDEQVVAAGDTTIVTQSQVGLRQGMFEGLGAAANTLGTFFQNEANHTHVLVRVAAGTPFGMFFIETVMDKSGTALAQSMNQNSRQPGSFTGNSLSPLAAALGQGNTGYGGMPGSYNPNTTTASSPYGTGAFTGSQNSDSQSNNTPYPNAGNQNSTSGGGGIYNTGAGMAGSMPGGIFNGGNSSLLTP